MTLHRLLLGSAVLVDHRDGNGLNNQRSNLRPATHAQNLQNTRKRAGTTSRFKGVCWNKKKQAWVAFIKHEGKKKYLGCFSSEEVAARAYDFAASETFGEFACLNFPNDLMAAPPDRELVGRYGRRGVKGCSWNERSQKWEAKIKSKGFTIHLGLFFREDDACAAYQAARDRLS